MEANWQITHITTGGSQIGVSNGIDIVWVVRKDSGEVVFEEKEPLPNSVKTMVERTFKNIHNGKINCSFSRCKFWYSADNHSQGQCKHVNGMRHNLDSGEILASQRGKDGHHSVLKCYLNTVKNDSSFWCVIPYNHTA